MIRAGLFICVASGQNRLMTPPDDKDIAAQVAGQGRTAALVIAAGGLLAIFAPVITRTLGLAPRFEMLMYLMSLAAFIWSLVVTWKLWQKTRDK